MDKYILANWKMNKDISDIDGYVDELKKNVKNFNNVVVFVPSVMIKPFFDKVKNAFGVGAQNCHYAESGAFTGEISAAMAKSAGAGYVIIGHSERRHYFDESDEFLNKKLHSVLSHGLVPVFCIGETLEEKKNFKKVLKRQIVNGFKGVTEFSKIIVAYEPVWAIGTGNVATIEDINRVHSFIRSVFKEEFNTEISLVYGGSVSPDSSKEILSLPEVDGVLVGGASLNPSKFSQIIGSR